jgi:kynureninase
MTSSSQNGTSNGNENGDGNSKVSSNGNDDHNSPSIYFVGNSLGAQPKAVRRYLEAQLETWASIGVNGHFNNLGESPLVAWQDMAEDCAIKSAHIVGASPSEVVIMNTLTTNLHLLMASFYKPNEKRHKIIIEWKPFPSDYVSRILCYTSDLTARLTCH